MTTIKSASLAELIAALPPGAPLDLGGLDDDVVIAVVDQGEIDEPVTAAVDAGGLSSPLPQQGD